MVAKYNNNIDNVVYYTIYYLRLTQGHKGIIDTAVGWAESK